MEDVHELIAIFTLEIDGVRYIPTDVCNVIIHTELARRARRGSVVYCKLDIEPIMVDDDEGLDQLN